MFTTSAIACVTLDADGKGEFLWQKAPATSRWPTPSDGPGARRYGSSGGCHSSTSINISSAASPPYSFGARETP